VAIGCGGLLLLLVLVGALGYWLVQGRRPSWAHAANVESGYGESLAWLRDVGRNFELYDGDGAAIRELREEAAQRGQFGPEVIGVSLDCLLENGMCGGFEIVPRPEWSKMVWGFLPGLTEDGQSIALLQRTDGKDYLRYATLVKERAGHPIMISITFDLARLAPILGPGGSGRARAAGEAGEPGGEAQGLGDGKEREVERTELEGGAHGEEAERGEAPPEKERDEGSRPAPDEGAEQHGG